MKVCELFEDTQPRTLDEFKKQVHDLWGSKVSIKKIESGDREFWCAKSEYDWKKHPSDASMAVGKFVLRNGKVVKDLSFVRTPKEIDTHSREAAKLKRTVKQQNKDERKAAQKVKSNFYVGQRVKLKPFDDEPEQEGEIVKLQKVRGMMIVQLDDKYIENEDDDGIRELSFDQASPLKRKGLN